MISKRVLMPLIVLGIFLTMGSMAFAQTNIVCGLSVPLGSTTNSPTTGHTEPIAFGPPATSSTGAAGGGTVRVTCVNSGGVGSASDPGVVALTISLGVPITNNTIAHPSAGAQVRLSAAPTPGAFVVAGAGQNVGISSLSSPGGTIVIGLGTPNGLGVTPTTGITFAAGPSTNQFDLQGVLVSVNGKTTPLAAALSSSGGISVGAPPATSGVSAQVTVITNILPGLKDPTVPSSIPAAVVTAVGGGVSGGAAVLNSAGTAIKGNFALRIEEGFEDMFRESGQFNGAGTGGNFPNSPSSDTQVEVRLNNIPGGLSIAGCQAVLTDTSNAISAGSPSINFSNLTAASPVLTVNFNANVDLTTIDVLWIVCTSVSVGTATLPLPSTPITAQATLAPTGAALSTAAGNPALTGLTTGQVPRYQLLLQPTTAVTVVVFPPSNSTLLVSFAAVTTGYDTGISVANTTADPFTPAGGGAPVSEGTVIFTMYKNDGTSKVYTTTTGSPGAGLTGAGVVKSGFTYSVNLSQLLTASSFGPSFIGYVFVTANFTNAHGSATVYLTSTAAAALSSPVLVLGAVSTAAPRPSPESLGQ